MEIALLEGGVLPWILAGEPGVCRIEAREHRVVQALTKLVVVAAVAHSRGTEDTDAASGIEPREHLAEALEGATRLICFGVEVSREAVQAVDHRKHHPVGELAQVAVGERGM